MIPKDVVKKVREEANLINVLKLLVHDFKKEGSSLRGTCPNCRNTSKKFYFVKSKNLYSCKNCDIGSTDAISFLMEYDGLDFQTAVRRVADVSGTFIDEVKKPVKRQTKVSSKPFVELQMIESGIPLNAIEFSKQNNAAEKESFVEFKSGSKDKYSKPCDGDDMIVNFFDLDYKPCKYKPKKSDKYVDFFRVRFKNPQLHLDKSGNAMKYWQPYGSGVHIFIPNELRQAFHDKKEIKTLHFEEGEKKAKKKCLHGMYAVGFMGINSIAYEEQLPQDIIRIIEACAVENVVFNLDADWKDIKIKANLAIDQRPRSFYTAIKKFQNYFSALQNQQIYLKIFTSSILNKYDEKGSDDLLNGLLKKKESKLLEDFENAMIDANGHGEYIEMHNITDLHEYNLKKLLNIHTPQALAEEHRDLLSEYSKFKIGRQEYRFNDEGDFELAQPLIDRDKFWTKYTKTVNGNEIDQFKFKYVGLNNFLSARGFGKYYFGGKRNYIFTNYANSVVTEMNPDEIRDYVNSFVEDTGIEEGVLEMIYAGGDQYLSARKFYNLKFKRYNFIKREDLLQYFYFKKQNENGDYYFAWQITKEGIKEIPFTGLNHHVWSDKINNVSVSINDSALYNIQSKKVESDDGTQNQLSVKFNPGSDKCQFLKFLSVTSIFNHQTNKEEYRNKSWKDKLALLSPEERIDHDRHLLAKITAIGYLLHEYRDSSVLKAVVAMDGRQSEVGSSNGRSGKSLLGMAIREVLPTEIINGKKPKIHEDRHIFSRLDERTRMCFFDDCTVHFNFEYFFPAITGIISVNPKGKDEFNLDIDSAPKFLFTTNHAFDGDGDSFEDRQHVIVFSDYFNARYKPVNEFGGRFFEDWDNLQWNLYYNFLAQCVKTYFEYKGQFNGPIPAPMEEVKQRKLRQFMGEDFLAWANEYYDQENSLNKRVERKEAFTSCTDFSSKNKKWITPPVFKKKVLAFCKFKGYRLNPAKEKTNGKGVIIAPYGGDDKSGGKEYFTVAQVIIKKGDQPF